MLIKYDPLAVPLSGRSFGSCFQNSERWNVLKNNAHMRVFRTGSQKLMSLYEMASQRHWQSFTSTQQANWQNWVDYLPQPTKRDPLIALSSYENYIKRQFYRFLFSGDITSFMDSPNLVTYVADDLTISVLVSSTQVLLDLSFTRSADDLDYLLSISNQHSSGMSFVNNSHRFVLAVRNISQQFDITSVYRQWFGLLPAVSSVLFFSFISCGKDNGQFFAEQKGTVVVQSNALPEWPYLYNHKTVTSPLNLTSSSDWYVPDHNVFNDMIIYLGGSPADYDLSPAAIQLCEAGFVHWNDIFYQTATNSAGLTLLGTGERYLDADYYGQKTFIMPWCSDFYQSTKPYLYYIDPDYAFLQKYSGSGNTTRAGEPIFIVKNAPGIADGVHTQYTGNDGKTYEAVCINQKFWLITGLRETKFRDQSLIENAQSNASWMALTDAAYFDPNSPIP